MKTQLDNMQSPYSLIPARSLPERHHMNTPALPALPTLYDYLLAHATGLCCWLPQSINRRGNLPATPRRIAWARRVLATGEAGYPGRCLAERLGGPSAVGGPEPEVERSIRACLTRH